FFQRPLSCFTPQARSLLNLPSLSAVTRQQLRPTIGNICELAFERLSDAGMERASRLTEQRAIGRILHQGMLEQISRMRWHALPGEQARFDETAERQFPLRLTRNCSQQGMGELPPNRRPDLCHFLAGAEPVEPGH